MTNSALTNTTESGQSALVDIGGSVLPGIGGSLFKNVLPLFGYQWQHVTNGNKQR
ncbi:MAG: hypothetical protein JZU65_11520 [Chlorobium sp.]|nr:hypothetical protein [Chlorobium sp.]